MCFLMIFFIEILPLCNMYFVQTTIINANCLRNVMLPRLNSYWRVVKIDYNYYNYNNSTPIATTLQHDAIIQYQYN